MAFLRKDTYLDALTATWEKKYAKALKLLKSSAASGDPNSVRKLISIYYSGDEEFGVPKDYDETVKWFEQAIRLGDRNAELNLAEYIQRNDESGYQTSRVLWLIELAAEHGDPAAQNTWGALLLKAKTFQLKAPFPDFFKWIDARGRGAGELALAAKYFQRAAVQEGSDDQWSVSGARFELGLMHRNGEGVHKDFALAHMWFNLAKPKLVGEKIKLADEEILDLELKMTPDQLAEAQRLARNAVQTRFAAYKLT